MDGTMKSQFTEIISDQETNQLRRGFEPPIVQWHRVKSEAPPLELTGPTILYTVESAEKLPPMTGHLLCKATF